MKRLSILFAVIVMMTSGVVASAQSRAKRGYAETSTLWAGYAPTTYKSGSASVTGFDTFFAGVTRMSPISGAPILLEYGGYVDWTNKKTTEGKWKYSYNLFDVKAPVNVVYPIQAGDNFTLLPYGGLHARAFVSGKVTEKYEDLVETDDFFEDSDMKRFVLGYQVGVRAQFSKFIVGIGYEDMLTSMSDDVEIKVNYLTLYVGFPF